MIFLFITRFHVEQDTELSGITKLRKEPRSQGKI